VVEDSEVSEVSEEFVARVASIDVAKASGVVCLRVPHDTVPGRRVQRVWTVTASTNAVLELADTLVAHGVEQVVMEATGVYVRREGA
jgi:hypothetical protein